MPRRVVLRAVSESDLPVFFDQGRDPLAVRMAAFTAKEPGDRTAFDARWARLLRDGAVEKRTVVVDGAVAGQVLSYQDDGRTEVCYWFGREFWGRGVATAAVSLFLTEFRVRPVYARVASDNVASTRVLVKCGFSPVGRERGFANGRGAEVEEVVFKLA